MNTTDIFLFAYFIFIINQRPSWWSYKQHLQLLMNSMDRTYHAQKKPMARRQLVLKLWKKKAEYNKITQ